MHENEVNKLEHLIAQNFISCYTGIGPNLENKTEKSLSW